MDASLSSLIDSVEPGCAATLPDLSALRLETKFLPALDPNPQLVRLLYRHVCHAEQKPRASLVIVHGFGEHSVKYMEAAARFALVGFDVHVLDQRTAGHSGGCKAGHDLYELVKDVNKLIQQTKTDLPCYLWGHSMGGLISTYLLAINPMLRLSGAIITSAAYRLANEVSPGLQTFVNLTAADSAEMMLAIQLPMSAISRNDVFTRALFEDRTSAPLAGFPYCVSFRKVQDFVAANVGNIRCPILLMHGDKDALTQCRATEEIFKKVGSTDKTLKIYAGGYHELHHDIEKDRFYREVLEWVEAKLPTARPLGSVGRLRTVPDVLAPKRNWSLWVILLALIYVIGFVLYRTKPPVKAVRWLAYTVVPKVLWPMFLPLTLLAGKSS